MIYIHIVIIIVPSTTAATGVRGAGRPVSSTRQRELSQGRPTRSMSPTARSDRLSGSGSVTGTTGNRNRGKSGSPTRRGSPLYPPCS